MIEYSQDLKIAIFNKSKFIKDDKTNYYLNSTTRKRLHREVWINKNGNIPKGFHIHHIDKNKLNNNISNLELIHGAIHLSQHGKDRSINNPQWIKKFQQAGIKKAPEWHKSKEGREWHKKHALEIANNMKEKTYYCLCCQQIFNKKPFGTNKFCSNNCKSKNRRNLGLDNIVKQCKTCKNSFIHNKYAEKKYCTKTCIPKNKSN